MGVVKGRGLSRAASSQASTIWAGIAWCLWVIWPSRSMMGWLAVRASGLKWGNRLRTPRPGRMLARRRDGHT